MNRKLVVFVPREALDPLREALFAAGAGRIGDYERCSWYTEGTGTFLGGEGTSPSVGQPGREERVAELRLETVFPAERQEAVVAALREALRSRAVTEYAVVDHGRDMAAAGAPGFAAWTLVFGNPAAGAKLLARDLGTAVDIPLRAAVTASPSGGSEIVFRDMRTLLPDDLTDLADAFTQVLRALAADARDRAVAR